MPGASPGEKQAILAARKLERSLRDGVPVDFRIEVPMANITIYMKGPDFAHVPGSEVPADNVFPLFDVYSDIVSFRGGTPVPESNTRYWNKPTYPTYDSENPAHSLVTTIVELKTALTSAAAGDFIFVQNGSYNNPGVITLANSGTNANPITVCAETYRSVLFQNDVEIKFNGNYNTFMGIDFTGLNGEPADTEGIYTFNGDYNVAAYSRHYGIAGDNANNNIWNGHAYGSYNRICYHTFDNKTADRACVRGRTGADYNRLDHCEDLNHTGTGDSGDIEFFQSNQNAVGDDGWWLVDNNYIYRWNNNGTGVRVVNSEREIITLKSSTNTIIQNVTVECCGTLNDRTSHRSTYYANWCFGGATRSGGISLMGNDAFAFCNYIIDCNSTEDAGVAGVGFFQGGGNYEQALRCEASFNTIINTGRSLHFGVNGDGGANPDQCEVYNTAIDYQGADTVAIDDADFTNQTWGGNVFKSPTGIGATGGITAATPQLTLDSGYYVPTAGGNCRGTGSTAHHALCTVDILGNTIPASSPNVGCFQDGWNLTTDPAQAIIDEAGA
jgi:hypothetical protein